MEDIGKIGGDGSETGWGWVGVTVTLAVDNISPVLVAGVEIKSVGMGQDGCRSLWLGQCYVGINTAGLFVYQCSQQSADDVLQYHLIIRAWNTGVLSIGRYG